MIIDTPVEQWMIGTREMFVKREDLACQPPGPPFAKVRGLAIVLENLKKQGVKTVGYMETSVSMAGWGISYFCGLLGMKAVIFAPQYKELRENQIYQFEKWKEFGGEKRWLEKPNRMQINFYRARKILKDEYPDAVMLPLGLPFQETALEVAKQVQKLDRFYPSIVVCVGSGTMTGGIILGLKNKGCQSEVYGIFCSPKADAGMKKKILSFSGIGGRPGFFNRNEPKLELIDEGYEYTKREDIACPFPCNPYYDRKAFAWMMKNYDRLKKPVLFWNIGSDYII